MGEWEPLQALEEESEMMTTEPGGYSPSGQCVLEEDWEMRAGIERWGQEVVSKG